MSSSKYTNIQLLSSSTSFSALTNHNDLNSLQGGQEDEYYHLTQNQHIQSQIISYDSNNDLITFTCPE